MNFLMVVILSLCGHAIGDFVLQTDFIAKAKSPNFWNDKTSWIVVLIAHCLVWGLCVFLPMFAYVNWNPQWWLCLMFFANIVIHFFADWMKCKSKTNLLQDQIIHYFQIAVSLMILCFAR